MVDDAGPLSGHRVHCGHPPHRPCGHQTIEPLIRCNTARPSTRGTSAKDCFDYLLDLQRRHLPRRPERGGNQVDGIITKTSMASRYGGTALGVRHIWDELIRLPVADRLRASSVHTYVLFRRHRLCPGPCAGHPAVPAAQALRSQSCPCLSVFNTIPGIVFIGLLVLAWWGGHLPTVLVALGIYATVPGAEKHLYRHSGIRGPAVHRGCPVAAA